MKTCPKCKETKQISEFHKSSKDGLQGYCKVCNKIIQRGVFSAAGAVGPAVPKAQQLDRIDKIQEAVQAEPTLTVEHKAEIQKELDAVREQVEQDQFEAEVAEIDKELTEIQRQAMAETPPTEAIPTPEKPTEAITEPKAVGVAPEAKAEKQPWEMTLQDFAEAGLEKGTIIAEGLHFREKGQIVIAAFRDTKTGKVVETGAIHDLNKIPKGGFESGRWDIGFVEEGKFYTREAYRFRQARNAHREIIRKALSENKQVPKNILLQYKSEKWAQEALAKPPTVAKAEPITEAEVKEFPKEALTDEQITKAEMGEIPSEGEYQSQSGGTAMKKSIGSM